MWSGLLLPLNQHLWALNVYLVIWAEKQMPSNEVIFASVCECVCVSVCTWISVRSHTHLLLFFSIYAYLFYFFKSQIRIRQLIF